MKYSSRGKKWLIAALMVAAAVALVPAATEAAASDREPALAYAVGTPTTTTRTQTGGASTSTGGTSTTTTTATTPKTTTTPTSTTTTPTQTSATPSTLATTFVPNDPGTTRTAGGWQKLQWNFADSNAGVHAPEAWENLIRDHHAGASGVVIAVLDTGVAYRNWDGYTKSPDFTNTKFVDPCDLVDGSVTASGRCTDPYPLDREGHGTFITGEIAEATNNRYAAAGLAYNAEIMPIRVLNAEGWGYPNIVAEGIRYAVQHGAQVINLSLAFYLGMTAAQIPELISAISYAHAHGVVVVAAAGNDGANAIAYPAADPYVISVGASTQDGCLAAYSNNGPKLDLVAPGGGDDAPLSESVCDSNRNLADIHQLTLVSGSDPDDFSLSGTYFGTSMAAPEVSAAAAMVIASRVIGAHPSPDAVLTRLEQTATQPIPGAVDTRNDTYGYGIVNAGAATSPLAQAVTSPTKSSPTTTSTTPATTTTATPATTPTTAPATSG